MSADPDDEASTLFPLENGIIKVQPPEEEGGNSFLSVEVWDWELYSTKGSKSTHILNKMNHRALKDSDRQLVAVDAIGGKHAVFLRGQVKSKTKVVSVRSSPLKFWSTQRVNSEYRVWLQSKQYDGQTLWYMVSSRCSKGKRREKNFFGF
jgi:hypothetical protein